MHKLLPHRAIPHILAVKPWYFLAIAATFGVVSVEALRANNEHMIQLRTAVYTADQKNVHVEEALKQLQAYVTSHMNTDLSGGNNAVYPPIQLKYTYDRLVQAESEALAQTNSAFYSTAQQYCEQQFSGSSLITRVNCTENYLQTHDIQHQLVPIPDALYKFAFISPRWSPDLAGWSLVIAAVSLLLTVLSFVIRFIRR